MNKKGDIFSIIIILVILLAVGIIAVLFGTLAFKFGGALKDNDILKTSDIAQEKTGFVKSSVSPFVEGLMFFLLFAGIIGLLYAAVYTEFSGITIFIFIFVILIVVLGASMAANMFQPLKESGATGEFMQSLPITSIIFSKYTALIFLVVSAIVIIIMYSKSGNATGGGI